MMPLPEDVTFPAFPPGWVWLTGAGPGDPGLLTLNAVYALQQADCVVYDALVDERVLHFAADGAECIYAGKRGGKPSPKQPDISNTIIALARRGKRVVRLKGGDPFVFGRGGEEALALVHAGVPFRIVPGVTAGIGGVGYAGIPVTHRDVNSVVTFLTGHDAHGVTPTGIDWAAVAKGSPVIVMYMALKHLSEIRDLLLAGGRGITEPVALIQDATTDAQRVVVTTLGRAPEDAETLGISPPAVVVLGHVVALRQQLDWFTGIMTHTRPDRPLAAE